MIDKHFIFIYLDFNLKIMEKINDSLVLWIAKSYYKCFLYILFYCTFYSLFFTYIYIYSLVLLHILHCPLSGPDLTYISLLIIFCIIECVTNKKTLNLMHRGYADAGAVKI